MRLSLLCGLIFCSVFSLASGQEQERKLLDRLLKPDMTLQNDAQQKQFVTNGPTLTKAAPIKSFYVVERKPEKQFWNTRKVSQKQFPTSHSRFSETPADLSTRSQITKVDSPYETGIYRGAREASDAEKSVGTSEFAGNRKFEGRGKSQKALSQQDRPLTIDQVRELLNKNK